MRCALFAVLVLRTRPKAPPAAHPSRRANTRAHTPTLQVSGGADLFVGFGGVVERPLVRAGADWYVYDYTTLLEGLQRYRVAMVGSGAW